MSIAFLILNHRPPEQLFRLLTTLRRGLPDAPICVHNDKVHVDISPESIGAINNVHLLTNDEPIGWGDYSVVEACQRSIEWMTDHLEFDWVVMLSAQDYPIKPLHQLDEYLSSTQADVVLRAVQVSDIANSAERRDRRRRYFYQYNLRRINSQDSGLDHRFLYRLQRLVGRPIDVLNISQPFFKIYRLPDRIPYRFGWRARSSPFTPSYPCWYGSMWFGLSHRACKFVVSSMQSRPDYVDYFRRTIIPDESAIATLVCNASDLQIENRDLHYVRWTYGKTGHPDILTAKDFTELQAVPEYFARKFDITVDADVLDQLDEIVIGGDPASRSL